MPSRTRSRFRFLASSSPAPPQHTPPPQTGDVLVIATDATVHSHAYKAACAAKNLRAYEKACPLLVPLVEEGWINHHVTDAVVRIYLGELTSDAAAAGMTSNGDGCVLYLVRAFVLLVQFSS